MGPRTAAHRPRAIPTFLVATACATVLGGLAIGPARANVNVNEVYTIPASGPNAGHLTILWRGNGHGHGLSQYGAQAAAQRGLTAARILDFYYPGTSRATTSGTIRVLLSAPRDDLRVQPTSTLMVVDTGNGNASSVLPASIDGVPVKQWRLGVDAHGKAVVSYLKTSWTAYRTLVGDGKFVDASLGYVTMLNPTAKRYAGALLAASPTPGDLHRSTVNVVDLERYVEGVVPTEMPPSWPAAALQAQAVAARTYALFERAAGAGRYYDICDTTACQVYGGMAATAAASNAAVTATKGVYLSYAARPAFTQFSSSNGGWESYGGYPYLPSKLDPYTPTAEQLYGRSYSWSKPTASVGPLESAYPSIGTLRSVVITSREGGTGATWRGRVMTMTLKGSAGSVPISGSRFAAIYGLSSTWFTLQVPAPAYAVGSHVRAAWTWSLGRPVGPELTATFQGVTGYYQRYPHGYALANSPYGTYRLNGSILLAWSPTVNGWPTHAMTRQSAFGIEGWIQRLQGGGALIASRYGVFASKGTLLAAWTPTRRGWPTARLRSATVGGQPGWVQTFGEGSLGSDYAFAAKSSAAVT